MAQQTGTVQSFLTPNYSGTLYCHTNDETPLLDAIAGRMKKTDSVEFLIGQEYSGYEEVSQPSISETASLDSPEPSYIKRDGEITNVCQIFQESFAISDAKKGNMGTLAGINIAGRTANPIDEETFQADLIMKKIKRTIETTFINGTYAKATNDGQANKTRGLIEAITTNATAMAGKPLGFWDVVEMLEKIDKANAPTGDLVIWADQVQILQLTTDAIQNGLTVIPADRTVNGVKLDKIVTPYGDIYTRRGRMLPAGTAMMLNLNQISPVQQIIKGKGNFYRDTLGKKGAGTQYLITGFMGLDHGPQWFHGKWTGLKTTWDRPDPGIAVTVKNSAKNPVNTKTTT